MDLPMDYNKIFNNKIVVITGVARSGTTILAKIIGSFCDVNYLFEPAIMLLVPPLIQKKFLSEKQGADLLKGVLFEDFYLQMIQGRYVNFNKNDDSYIGNYLDLKNVEQRWEKYKRKIDVIDDLENKKSLFIIKSPNVQPYLSIIKKIFTGVRFIDVIRDGNDIISSSIRRGFYSDNDLNGRIINWSYNHNKIKIPCFIEDKDMDLFSNWNHHTRVAYIWRILTEKGLQFAYENKQDVIQFKFEDFIQNTEKFVEETENFIGKKRTDITMKHIDSIKSFKQKQYPDNITNIESPERERYMELREKLGYSSFEKCNEAIKKI